MLTSTSSRPLGVEKRRRQQPLSPIDPLAPTVFHQPWWLETVTNGAYSEAVVTQDSRKIGSFPYVAERLMAGHVVCGMPPLTHFLGPAIDEGQGAACNRVLKRAQITRELLAQVRGFSGFWQKLHRNTPETLVYQEQGYTTTVQFTFEVPTASPDMLWRNMRDKTRNAIRRGEAGHTGADIGDLSEFAAFYTRNVAEAGGRSRYGSSLLERACGAAILRGQGRLLGARDKTGRLAAAIFYIWDTQSAYYLLSTRRRDSGNGAVSLLIWQAMQDIAARGLIFDFEGVANSGSALFFTGFGGQITPRFVASRFSLKHKIVGRLTDPFRKSSGETYL